MTLHLPHDSTLLALFQSAQLPEATRPRLRLSLARSACIVAFARKSGVPILLNTSFNWGGNPIVETPAEAVLTFSEMPIEALVLEDRLVVKQ